MNEIKFTSLCYVREDPDRRLLKRLADIRDDKLCTPFKSDRPDKFYENRDVLYCKGQSQAPGTVGVWDWTSIPKLNNPDTDYVESHYVGNRSPIRIVTLPVKSLEEVIERLIIGSVHTQAYFCNTLFCSEPKDEKLSGVFCHINEFKIIDRYVNLMDNVYTLPCFEIQLSDIYYCEDGNLKFFNTFNLGESTEYIPVRNADELLRTLIIKRSSWSLFKDSIFTRKDWQNSKAILKKVCEKSLYETVADELKYTFEQAKQTVDAFVKRANNLIDAGDIDANVLAQICMNHDELRSRCEEMISIEWRKAHAAEISEAENAVAAIKNSAVREVEAAKRELLDVTNATASSREKRDELLSEISIAQNKLEQLFDKIEQYEMLGNDTLAGVRQKIAEAQKDMASFLTDISMFLPQSTAIFPVGKCVSSWKYVCAAEKPYPDEDIVLAESWNDEFDMISQNLAHAFNMDTEFSLMLTAFLYSIHINNIPMLIAGPGGGDIAEVLSVSMFGSGAGRLTLGNECEYDITEKIRNCNEQVVSIQNMFGEGWTDILPQEFCAFKKQIIWTHPYVEDMLLEPESLYNYMLPMLSEGFVRSIPARDSQFGIRADNFKTYVPQKVHPFHVAAFRRLGLNKLRLTQLERILSDAKTILGHSARNKDMEILFGLLPLAILTGKNDILKEVIESEGDISNSVKTEVTRYFGEV